MAKLTLTNKLPSTIAVGDPGFKVFTLAPEETKVVEVTEGELRLLMPHLDRVKAPGWIDYGIGADAVIEVPPTPPVAPPAPPPVVVPEAPVAVADTVTATPVEQPAEVPTETTVTTEEAVAVTKFSKGRNK